MPATGVRLPLGVLKQRLPYNFRKALYGSLIFMRYRAAPQRKIITQPKESPGPTCPGS